MPITTNWTQTIVAGSALLLIVALACAAAKSLLLFVVVTYLMFGCWYMTKPEAPPRQFRRFHGSRSTGLQGVLYDGPLVGKAFAVTYRDRWSELEPFDCDEIGLNDSAHDFARRRSACLGNVAGYDESGRDTSGRDISGYDETGFDTMGYDACGYDRAGHSEHQDHVFHDFIESGNHIDTDWLSTPVWESA